MRSRADRFRMNGIHERQDEQIEHAAAQNVAERNIRQRRERGCAESSEQLRETRCRREQDDANPAPTQSALLPEHVAITGETRARQNDDERRGGKLQPDHRLGLLA